MNFGNPAIRGGGLMAVSCFAGVCCWLTIPLTGWIETYIDRFGFTSELMEGIVILFASTLAMLIAPSISISTAYWSLCMARSSGRTIFKVPAWVTLAFAALSSLYVLLLLFFLVLWMLVGHAS